MSNASDYTPPPGKLGSHRDSRRSLFESNGRFFVR